MVEGKNYEEDWFSVGRFSSISALEEGQREFLEAINTFRYYEASGRISDKGIEMPDIKKVPKVKYLGQEVEVIPVGFIHGIEFVPDIKNPNDGEIVVLKRTYKE